MRSSLTRDDTKEAICYELEETRPAKIGQLFSAHEGFRMMADTKSMRLNYLSLLTKSPCSFKRTILAGEVKS